MRNVGVNKAQTGIKIAGRNINNLRYADGITLGLKLNIQIMASDPITSWQIDGEPEETVTDFYFLELQNHCRW